MDVYDFYDALFFLSFLYNIYMFWGPDTTTVLQLDIKIGTYDQSKFVIIINIVI